MKRILNVTNKFLWKEHSLTKNFFMMFSPGEAEAMNKGKSPQTLNSQPINPRLFNKRQRIGLILGPLLFLLTILFFEPEGLSAEGQAILATTLWMATWWMTEAIPIPATALLPIILFPLTGGLDVSTTTSSYASDVIFLFMGGFVIALAVERWDLHRRIALSIISVVGTNVERLILGFMVATGFLSMWISSTATAMMMLPIGTAILYKVSELLKEQNSPNSDTTARKFEKALLLSIMYSALIGGLGTLIGTPPNIILAGYVSETYGVDISFGQWMMFGVPIAIIFTAIAWVYLVKVAFPLKIKDLPGGRDVINNQRKELGAMSKEEKIVSIVFSLTAAAWISRTFLLEPYVSPHIDDSMIAMTAALVLFLIPSRQKPGEALMTWDKVKELPWGILILFGGGLAIAAGFQSSGLTEWIGSQLTALSNLPLIVIILAVIVLVLLLTEFMSNTATATVLIPVMGSLAIALDVHPYALLVATAVAASCAFMFPIAAPPNAIIYSSGVVNILEMARTGVWFNLLLGLMLTTAVYWLLPLVWQIDVSVFPT